MIKPSIPIDETRTQLGHVEIESMKCGGFLIQAVEGVRAQNGRMSIEGIDWNSSEVQQVPGENCNTPGVMTQWLMYTRKFLSGAYKRICRTVMYDGTEVGDFALEESTCFGDDVSAMTMYAWRMGAKIHLDGSTTGQKDSFTYFWDGSHELSLSNGDRVGIVSVIEAWLANDKTKIVARDKDGKPIQYQN